MGALLILRNHVFDIDSKVVLPLEATTNGSRANLCQWIDVGVQQIALLIIKGLHSSQDDIGGQSVVPQVIIVQEIVVEFQDIAQDESEVPLS